MGQGNITIHGHKRPRYRCHACGCTRERSPGNQVGRTAQATELIVVVVTLLAYGCPLQAIVHAYGLDERTVVS